MHQEIKYQKHAFLCDVLDDYSLGEANASMIHVSTSSTEKHTHYLVTFLKDWDELCLTLNFKSVPKMSKVSELNNKVMRKKR